METNIAPQQKKTNREMVSPKEKETNLNDVKQVSFIHSFIYSFICFLNHQPWMMVPAN